MGLATHDASLEVGNSTHVRFALRIATLASLILCSACSFVLVHGPPRDHVTQANFDCTESNILPTLDLFEAAFSALMQAATSHETTNEGKQIGWGYTGMYLVASIVGFHKVSDCGEAKRALENRRLLKTPLLPVSSPPGTDGPAVRRTASLPRRGAPGTR